MKGIARIIVTVAALIGTWTLLGASAWAQSSRTWVSGVGDDANPCSRTAPCKTFAGAISKTAVGGEVDALDPGGFGAVTITKSITIDGGGVGVVSVLYSGTNGININSSTAVVILRNIALNGIGAGLNGVNVLAAAAVHIEKVSIFGNSGIPSSNAKLEILDSTITDNVAGGILIKPGAGATAAASLFRVNSSRNLFGIRVEDGGKASVHESLMSENAHNGFLAFSASAPSELNVEDSMTANNLTSGVAASGAGATIRLTRVGIYDNATGLSPTGGAIISFGNNQNAGNGVSGAPTSTVSSQ